MCQITREAMEKQHTQKITLDIHLIQLETLCIMPIRHSLCVFQVKTTTLCLPSFRVASQMLTNTQLFLFAISN